MRISTPSILGVAAMVVLPACASTTLASTPTPPTVATTTTVPVTTTSTPTTTTLPPTTTSTTTTTTKVPVTTTTTTIPPVPAADPPLVGVGTSDGDETRRAQQRLLDLGFWLSEADGDYGLTTRQAVMAFQKYHGLTTDGVLGGETARVLSETTVRPVARADAGTLVEVDKDLQLLFFVIDGRVEWVLNTSTGSEIPYRTPNKNNPTSGRRVTRSPATACTRCTASAPKAGGRVTSARSTGRSTSRAASRCTARTTSPTTPPRTAACG
jgi:peptidoglycan hydrolase-like protein with peptidoglycan-binding domain